MLSLLVLADDFTGALDTGVQFAHRGAVAYVTRNRKAAPPPGASVLVVDTHSRHLPPREAYDRVFAAVKSHPAARVYKKTDSVLRGNIGAELAAVCDALGEQLHFVPAFPRTGRTTEDGVQKIAGVPIHLTGFAQDPANPVTESCVAAVIARQTGKGVTLSPDLGGDIVVYDAITEQDLADIAASLPEGARALAGCAGFAAHIPARAAPAPLSPRHRGPVLTLSGSVAGVTLEQLAHMRERGRVLLRLSFDARALAEEVATRLMRGENVVAATALPGDMIERVHPQARDRLSALPGELVARVLSLCGGKAPYGSLCVVGGDALTGVVDALGIAGLWPLRELSPGVALSATEGGGPLIATKSGGFGGVEILWETERELSS